MKVTLDFEKVYTVWNDLKCSKCKNLKTVTYGDRDVTEYECNFFHKDVSYPIELVVECTAFELSCQRCQYCKVENANSLDVASIYATCDHPAVENYSDDDLDSLETDMNSRLTPVLCPLLKKSEGLINDN